MGSGGIVPRIHNLALNGGEWSSSRSGCLTLRERVPLIHWIGPRRSRSSGEEKNYLNLSGIEPWSFSP